LKKALQRLKTGNEYQDLDIDFVEYETDMWDDVLKNYCIVESKKNHTSPIICIFDRDKIDVVQRIEENWSPKKRWNNVYSFAIPKPDNRTFNEVCIEHYYTDDEIKTLDTNNRRLFLWSDFSAKYNTFCDTTGNWTKLKDKAGKNTIIDDRIYEVWDEIWTNNIALSKSAFSQNIYDDVDWFNSFDITNFKLIFEKIQLILNPQTPENDQPTTEI
jgi:RNA-directed DNA polymerase